MMHIRTPSDTTFEFYAIRASVAPRRPRIELSPPSEASSAVDPIARLTRECAALRLRLATAERRQRLRFTGSFTAPCSPPSAILDLALETASAHGNAARDQVQIGVMKLSERYRALEKTMREMQESLRLRDREIEALREERDRLLREREQTKAERDQAKIECDQERVKNHSLTKEIKHLQEHVRCLKHGGEDGSYHYRSRTPSHSRRAARRSEAPSPVPQGPNSHPSTFLDVEEMARVKSRDVFLTKTDNWSGAQVIQAIDDLNAEINQFAASATESCTFARRRMRNPVARGNADADEESAPWLGEAFVRLLEARDHARDPILLQLALQASLATCCARSLALFCVGFPSKLDSLMSRVLTYMHSIGAFSFRLTETVETSAESGVVVCRAPSDFSSMAGVDAPFYTDALSRPGSIRRHRTCSNDAPMVRHRILARRRRALVLSRRAASTHCRSGVQARPNNTGGDPVNYLRGRTGGYWRDVRGYTHDRQDVRLRRASGCRYEADEYR
ncbi:uncharacterized protein LAESUDRAFT_731929 [Laetiporus sulphureus 93-53]|uniref:Uncharacterized protein n=1 Tax=Laetiporus sulphureus 93-53 TaxID=1314785 RepID=A0A165BD26_9APHY|nr:uncharacterized protein LAESUDRAFT_731929 [Laetiporus sulphureus 93-53]KZT00776.1 hypothetical protein LAESUDRAFT_731929 [Laetiporus sulphureus 93-53]